MVVVSAPAQTRDRRDDRGRDQDRERGPRIILYQDAEYRGDSLVLYPGEAVENLSGQTFPNGAKLNDSISSVRVEGGAEVYVHADARFRGAAMRLTESARDLTGRLLPGSVAASWNDRIYSLRVEERRREGPDRIPMSSSSGLISICWGGSRIRKAGATTAA